LRHQQFGVGLVRYLAAIALVLSLAGCGDKDESKNSASQRASEITKAQVAASGGAPGAGQALKDDAQGCKDKAKALELIGALKKGETQKAIKLWADGMKDQTCRGFAPGLPVKIDHTEGDLACILPGDDPENKRCFFIDAKAL
jgi:predicted small lipoprotein YifL